MRATSVSASRPIVSVSRLEDFHVGKCEAIVVGLYLVERQCFRGAAAAIDLAVDVVQVPARPVTQQHRGAHAAVHLYFLAIRFLEYRQVHKRHYGARYPKGYA